MTEVTADARLAYAHERFEITDADVAGWTVSPKGETPKSASGVCPKCHHQCIVPIRTRVAVGTVAAAATSLKPKQLDRQFICSCNMDHNRPADVDAGCGRWWLVTLEQQDNGEYRVCAAKDDSMLDAAKELHRAQGAEDVQVRTRAEKWLAGITALFGLFGLTGIAVGKDAVSTLDTGGKIAVATAVGVSVALAATAVTFGYRAAYGWPTLVDVGDRDQLQQWKKDRDQQAQVATRQLKVAIEAALGALGALVIAVGFIWLWPAATPAQPTLQFKLNDSSQPCGTFISWSPQGQVKLRDQNGDIRSVIASRIVKVNLIGKCP